MALRLASKIRCTVVQSLSRSLAAKAELSAAPSTQQQQPQQQQSPQDGAAAPPTGLQRYNVYQALKPAENETMVKQQMDSRQLQPCRLPDYYQPEIDVQHATYPIKNTLAHDAEPLSLKQRRFEVSKTYANVTLPLKAPKLASPFPDPVKIMSSHTISDQEKAEQMLAEARVPRGTVEPAQAPKPALSRVQTRNYSKKTVGPDDEKCKKTTKKKKCVKMVAPGCKPPKSISCDREPKPIICKKVNAPYPSYSEACYEEVPQKPSECKMCPWRPKDNPNFKPKKKEYHTAASTAPNGPPTVTWTAVRGMRCDARKPPCKDPNAKKSDKSKKKKDKAKKGKDDKKKGDKKGKGDKKKKKKGGKKAAGWTAAVREWNAREELEPDAPPRTIEAMAKKKGKKPADGKKKKKKRPCKKFPFDNCKKRKDKKRRPKPPKCRPRKKWPYPKGCLAESSWETVPDGARPASWVDVMESEARGLQAKKDKKKKSGGNISTSKKSKLKITRNPDGTLDCEKPQDHSRKCPGDLLDKYKRKPRPKLKTRKRKDKGKKKSGGKKKGEKKKKKKSGKTKKDKKGKKCENDKKSGSSSATYIPEMMMPERTGAKRTVT